jgi:hypothetical protein
LLAFLRDKLFRRLGRSLYMRCFTCDWCLT